MREALDSLHRYGSQSAGSHRRQEHQRNGENLRQYEGPVGCGCRIDNLVEATVPVAPHQFAGVVDRDDERNDGEAADKRFHHDTGYRVNGVVVQLVGVPQCATCIEEADGQQHHEGGAAKTSSHIEPRQRRQLRPSSRRRAAAAMNGGCLCLPQCGRCRCCLRQHSPRFRLLALLGGFLWLALYLEQAVCQSQ